MIMEAGGRSVSLVLRRMNARAASGLQRRWVSQLTIVEVGRQLFFG